MAHSNVPFGDLASCLSRPPEGFYTSEVPAVSGWPVRTFLPLGYEPNYPYPLLVFLHQHGGNEEQILRLAPRLSRRNFVCVALRGPHQLAPRDDRPAYSWGPDGEPDSLVEEYLFGAVEQTRRVCHIHSERIYLVGFCEGAAVAYRVGLLYPEKFAGIVSLNGCMPRRGCPLMRFPQVRQLRAFIGHGIANAIVPLSLAGKDQRLLYTAGLDVRMNTYPANHRIHRDMLRDVNRWIIDQVTDEDYPTG
jgi:phospholipase/carboxylesterase